MLPLSVIILARDSANTIERAVASVHPVAQQIIVLDTGSQDNTPELCVRLGAEVYFAEWTDDFAAARNAALQYVCMPWVLALDSDEELEAETLQQQRHLLEEPEIGGIEVQIRSVASVQSRQPLVQQHWYPRLFRYAEGITYVGRVHEQIRPAIQKKGWRIVRAPIIIWHYGYVGEQLQRKAQRNVQLLQGQADSTPDDAWLQYHLGMSLFSLGESEKALELLERCSQHPELQPEQRLWSRLRAAQAALKLDRIGIVEELLADPFPEPGLEGLRRYVLAAALLQRWQFADALRLLDSPVVLQSPFIEREQVEHFLRALRQLVGE